MTVVVAPDHVHHNVATGVWCGVTEASDELPARAEIIATACAAAGAPMVQATDHGLDALLRVHDLQFLRVLRTAHQRWVADGHLEQAAIPYVTPYFFPPVAGPRGGVRGRGAATIRAEIGFYAMDTMTCIGEGTWTGAKAAADAAATAADLIADGAGVAYAVCRPPGHHAGPAFFGGSCYLNNAAVAAAQLRAAGLERVAIVDVDAHHGNGTEDILRDRPNLLFVSVHQYPGYPGTGTTSFANCQNFPVAPHTPREAHMADLARSWDKVLGFKPDLVPVSAGFDAYARDPITEMTLEREDFATLGRWLGESGLPAAAVLEGGYDLGNLPRLVAAHLAGLSGLGVRPCDEIKPIDSGL